MNLSRKKIYQVVIQNCCDGSICYCMGFYSSKKNAMKAIDVDLAMPMPGTRVRKADDDLWMEVSLPNTTYDETAYLYKGTEYVGNENKAFNWLIVEHEVDPVIYCHPGR